MEFSEAITLDQWMSAKTLDPVSKETVFKNTLDILVDLHGNNIAHGCLNPSNIYVSSDKSVKIGGFGAQNSSTENLVKIGVHEEKSDF